MTTAQPKGEKRRAHSLSLWVIVKKRREKHQKNLSGVKAQGDDPRRTPLLTPSSEVCLTHTEQCLCMGSGQQKTKVQSHHCPPWLFACEKGDSEFPSGVGSNGEPFFFFLCEIALLNIPLQPALSQAAVKIG